MRLLVGWSELSTMELTLPRKHSAVVKVASDSRSDCLWLWYVYDVHRGIPTARVSFTIHEGDPSMGVHTVQSLFTLSFRKGVHRELSPASRKLK